MMKRSKHMKASDVFQETKHFLAQKGSFADAFPEIADLSVEVEETGDAVWGTRGENRKYIFHKGRPPGEYINCSNPQCYNGGFSIGDILRGMVMKKEAEHESSEYCQGYEGSPKGRKHYRNCMNSFKVKVKITYK